MSETLLEEQLEQLKIITQHLQSINAQDLTSIFYLLLILLLFTIINCVSFSVLTIIYLKFQCQTRIYNVLDNVEAQENSAQDYLQDGLQIPPQDLCL